MVACAVKFVISVAAASLRLCHDDLIIMPVSVGKYLLIVFLSPQFSDKQAKAVNFIDFPGHGSQRHRLHQKFSSARAVVRVLFFIF